MLRRTARERSRKRGRDRRCQPDQVKPVDGLDHPGLKSERGHLVLCAHGDYDSQVYFRNMRLKELR